VARLDPILIAGGGIAGLSLSVALARRGIASRILERNSVFSEAGAGIQLGPNAIGVLRRLGVAPRLAPHAAWPASIDVRDGRAGHRITRLPLGAWVVHRYGEPYGVVHRADLQTALLETAKAESAIEIVEGFRVENVGVGANGGITADSEEGDRQKGQALIGADGIWSSVRRWIEPEADLNFSGKTASRAILPIEEVAEEFRDVTTVWLMPGAHVVHYPVRGGRAMALVVVIDGPWPGRGWGHATDAKTVLARVAGADSKLISLLKQASEWRSWALYDPAPLSTWFKGSVCLMGDAAHPVLPFLAQGGVMALEDAETLAVCIARFGDDFPTAFAAYEAQRKDRVERVQRASRRNGTIFHASGLSRVARDAALRAAPGALMMARYDWLYGWDGPVTPP
jgi:salicylate hydroxylase